jgi:glycolate oxidase FAD binding subunit
MTHRPERVAELAAMVREAHDRSAPLRVVGGGSWMDAGRSGAAGASRLETGRLTGIVEYVPGDLTLTARAGTTLAELDAVTAPNGQWCPLLPWGGDDATLGAVFSTATSGPFEQSLGRPRDLALGLEFVDGTGAIARGGGRVVKNVAGFDLTRLLVGSWGTLGVITEVSVRLRARPPLDETWALALDATDGAANERLAAFETGPLAPLSLSRLSRDETRSLSLGEGFGVLVRIGGNATLVAEARHALRAVGTAQPCDASVWTRYRAIGGGSAALAFSGATADALSRRIKRQFDPRHVLNRGMFGEEPA